MEAVESESESLGQEIQIMSERSICHPENVKGFQRCFQEILTLIEKNEEIYDLKKSQFTKLVTDLSRMHGELADIHLTGEVSKNTTPIKTQHVTFSSSGGGFHISKRECSEFSSDSGHKQLISPVNEDATKVKETKVGDPDVLLKMISVLEEDVLGLQKKIQNLSEENSNLKRNFQEKESELQSEKANLEDEKAKVVELEKHVSDLKLEISESNRKIEKAHDEVVRLCSKLVEQYGYLRKYESTLESLISLTVQIEEQNEAYGKLEEQVSVRNDKIKKLKAKNNGLKTQLIEKSWLVENLNHKYDSVMSEKDGVKAQLDTLQAQMCSRDTKIQKLETRLGSLQADYERVVLSFDGEKNITNDLKLKEVELEKEMSQVTQTLTPDTEKFMTPVGFDVTFGGGFHISKRECSEFSSDSGHKQLIAPVTEDATKVKETKVDDPDVLPKKISVLEEDVLRLQKKLENLSEENSNLKRSLHGKKSDLQSKNRDLKDEKAKVVELEKQVSELKLVISESTRKLETTEKVLEGSRKQVSKAYEENARLSSQVVEQSGFLDEFKSGMKSLDFLYNESEEQLHKLKEKIALDVSVRDDEIKKLKAKNNGLKTQLIEKGRLVEDLNQKHDSVVKAQLDTLQAEMCSRDTKIEELETLLGSLQTDHERVVLSFDGEKNDLKLKVVELEKEVDRQREVMSDRAEEKREAIRQLSISLEHYMSEYKQLRQAFVKQHAVSSSRFYIPYISDANFLGQSVTYIEKVKGWFDFDHIDVYRD